MNIDYEQILNRAELYSKDIFAFLRDMIAIPSESGDEEAVIMRIKKEMEKVGFDRTEIDPMGNLLGFIGNGKHVIAIDGHIDTVGLGDPNQWKHDPLIGYEDDEFIFGRGASDQEGGMASAVYAGKIIKDLGLEDDY
ncbi:MAG: M20/M25/M40 family metallo-hydrolase, partial [Candidatus Marinimicrobia bacterium]|nr:M20/M25/M40 family metallo-hydrolase [Candidatus Neomarinimicrobiota bacterium]